MKFARLFLIGISLIRTIRCCTNVLVTPSATINNEVIIAYNADALSLEGKLYHYPSRDTSPGDLRKIWDWDSGVYLGEIPEFDEGRTYNVIGNTNEFGLTIAESTFGGVSKLADHQFPESIVDYGSLIWITLQRCKTARQAIKFMTDLLNTYGYASTGESFSIGDNQGEVWIMELIGKGQREKGAVWVARRIPDGFVSAHSNQARITTFPRDDPDNCLYAADVVEFAKKMDLYESDPRDPYDLKFSFSDVYNPVNAFKARLSEARTWSIFSLLTATDDDNDESDFQNTYLDYALGKNISHRMPLWIKPSKKLNFTDIQNVMSNHYEDTELSPYLDVGSGFMISPYRTRPLTWEYNSQNYINERTVATQQTGWNFIAQIRLDMPYPLNSVLWFAVDDSSTTARFPVYGCSKEVSRNYGGKGIQDGVKANLLKLDFQRAFWVQNMVSNLVYSRFEHAYPVVREKIKSVETEFQEELDKMDNKLLKMYHEQNHDTDEISKTATDFSVNLGDRLHSTWLEFYMELFPMLRDFAVITESKENKVCGCHIEEVGFPNTWKESIAEQTGDKYKIKPDVRAEEESGIKDTKSTLNLRLSNV